MALNNSGDDVELLDGSGAVVDAVSYGSAQEGAVLQAEMLRLGRMTAGRRGAL